MSKEKQKSEGDTVMEENTPETAREANRLAWVAIWISVVAVVISAVSVVISLSMA